MHVVRLLMAAIVAGSVSVPVRAQEDWKGKTVDLYVGYTIGGGYDIYMRILARHIGRHIPGGPAVIPKNMDGAASIRLANWLYNVAPKDGTVFGSISRGAPFDPLFGLQGAQFDANKFNWIGSMNNEVSICAAMKDAGVSKLEDLYSKELILGGTASASDTDQFPKAMNGTIGTRFKLVTGYPGGNEIVLAMQRGEVQGRCGWSWSSVKTAHSGWWKDGTIKVLVQVSTSKHADLPDVPLMTELAKTDEHRQIFRLMSARQVMGRPFLAPPGIPAPRVEALRKAFMDTMADKEFMAEADKAKLEINPVPGAELQDLVAEIYRTPPEVARKIGEITK